MPLVTPTVGLPISSITSSDLSRHPRTLYVVADCDLQSPCSRDNGFMATLRNFIFQNCSAVLRIIADDVTLLSVRLAVLLVRRLSINETCNDFLTVRHNPHCQRTVPSGV